MSSILQMIIPIGFGILIGYGIAGILPEKPNYIRLLVPLIAMIIIIADISGLQIVPVGAGYTEFDTSSGAVEETIMTFLAPRFIFISILFGLLAGSLSRNSAIATVISLLVAIHIAPAYLALTLQANLWGVYA